MNEKESCRLRRLLHIAEVVRTSSPKPMQTNPSVQFNAPLARSTITLPKAAPSPFAPVPTPVPNPPSVLLPSFQWLASL
eukprot:34358-Eustigmatos_ZCMA.PRE.1